MSLEDIRRHLGDCTRCPLHASRTHLVFGEGAPDADILLIGEAPGAREDAEGRPFVGASGKLLDRMLERIGLSRGEGVPDLYEPSDFSSYAFCDADGDGLPVPALCPSVAPEYNTQFPSVAISESSPTTKAV